MKPVIFLAGGGTGGHVYPLVAVADALRCIDSELGIVFVGTERGIEKNVVPARGYELELVNVQPIRGRGFRGAWCGINAAFRSLPECNQLLKKWHPAAVLTVGGYAAGPVSALCRVRGIPLALLEPNAVMGLSNRLVAPFVQRAYTAFSEAECHCALRKVLRAGVPLRQGFAPSVWRDEHCTRQVLVMGGSQGARALNESVPRALSSLSVPIAVRHQCGTADVDRVRDLYVSVGMHDAVVESFIDDVPAALRESDLVISRSGASAVSEICAVGRASLLVPYPFAAGNHQEKNAIALAQAGAARWIANRDATSERLRKELEWLFGDSARLEQMADMARSQGRPNAATVIAEDLLKLAGWSEQLSDRELSKEKHQCFADA